MDHYGRVSPEQWGTRLRYLQNPAHSVLQSGRLYGVCVLVTGSAIFQPWTSSLGRVGEQLCDYASCVLSLGLGTRKICSLRAVKSNSPGVTWVIMGSCPNLVYYSVLQFGICRIFEALSMSAVEAFSL